MQRVDSVSSDAAVAIRLRSCPNCVDTYPAMRPQQRCRPPDQPGRTTWVNEQHGTVVTTVPSNQECHASGSGPCAGQRDRRTGLVPRNALSLTYRALWLDAGDVDGDGPIRGTGRCQDSISIPTGNVDILVWMPLRGSW